jgi:hypothetical protein
MSTTIDEDRRDDGNEALAAELDLLVELIESGEPTGVRDYLESLHVNVRDLDTLAKWNVDGQPEAANFQDAMTATRARIRAILSAALAALTGEPYGAVRLLAYVVNECGEAWEVSYHYEPIWATLAELDHQWRTAQPWRDPWEQGAGEALLVLGEHLSLGIHGENSMTCGFIREAGVRFRKAHAAAVRATELAGALREDAGRRAADDPGSARAAIGAATFIEDWTASTIPHDDGTAWAAERIADFLDGTARLEAGANPLAAVESHLLHHYLEAETFPGDEDEGENWSELRAQRLDLDLLRDAQDEPWLYVDDGMITYLFPFALRRRPGTPEVQSHQYDVYEEKLRGQVDAAAEWELCGAAPQAVHREFQLDDVWHSTDAAGRRFDGVLIELEKVILRGPADDGSANDGSQDDGSQDGGSEDAGPVLATLRAEIRVSKLGNHYVRFEGRVRDANPADLYAALRRPAPEHGAFTVQYAGKEWHRLSTLAMELISDLANRLEATKTAREGMFQVLLTVAAASTGRGPAAPRAERTDIRSIETLRAAVGAPVLFNPVSHVMTSLAEWIRYETAGKNTVDDGSARKGHALVRTCNTTVHLALGAPHWELGTAVTVTEFVASLDGLFARWMEELNDFQASVNAQRHKVDAASDSDAEHLREQVNELRRIRLGLQTFVTDCRSMIALVNSPALVRSPVVAANLAAMVEAAGIRRRAEEFDRQAAEILSDRLDEIIERAARDQEDAVEKERQVAEAKHRTRMDTLLASIAAVGVSGLGQILQAGYGLQGGVTLQIALGIVALAVVVGVGVWLVAPRTSRTRTPEPPVRATAAAVPKTVVPKQARRGGRPSGPDPLTSGGAGHPGHHRN